MGGTCKHCNHGGWDHETRARKECAVILTIKNVNLSELGIGVIPVIVLPEVLREEGIQNAECNRRCQICYNYIWGYRGVNCWLCVTWR